MKDILQYAFLSTASEDFKSSDLACMKDEMDILNKHLNVTGVLVFDGIHLLVILEGKSTDVVAVSMAMENDTRYTDIQIVMLKATDKRLYQNWNATYCNTQSRPPLDRELKALHHKVVDNHEAISLKDTKIMSYLSAFQEGAQMQTLTTNLFKF